MFDYTREKVRQLLWDAQHRLGYWDHHSVLTTPLVQALAVLDPPRTIDLLVNKQKGADIVFSGWDPVNKVWDRAELQARHTPVYYGDVLECHPRHDLPLCVKYRRRLRIAIRPTPGLDYHWLFEKHEAEYLLDLARALGYVGARPPIRKLVGNAGHGLVVPPQTIAIGIGYYKGLRADGRDWSDRHWGNANFLELCRRLEAQGHRPVLVGDQKDFERDGHFLADAGVESICGKLTLSQFVDYLGKCRAYIGNDSGLMHIAASVGIPTVGIFVSTNSVKSYPLGAWCVALGGDQGPRRYEISVSRVLQALKDVTLCLL
jgi:hypothetical protein